MNRAVGVAVLAAMACARTDAQPRVPTAAVVADTAHPWRKPGDTIDSILPMEEYLRRFRTGLIEPDRLRGGALSPKALAGEFLAALARHDSAGIGDLLITRSEFAWLVFPAHRYAAPPYELDPAVFWLQLNAETGKGFTRTLRRYGGERVKLLGLDCRRDTLQVRRGAVVVWSPCQVRFQAGDSVVTGRIFGSIVERDGRAKLLSLAGEF